MVVPAPTGPVVPRSELKIDANDKTRLSGLLLPFGGLLYFKGQNPDTHPGSDSYGEHFSPKTEFALQWGQKAGGWPLLYHHGRDPGVDIIPVGRIDSIEMREADPKTGARAGGWMQAQLDEQNAYFDAITAMIDQGKLFLSSGAMNHLIRVNKKSGEILRWPVVEGSLTPTASCLAATVDYTTATRHYKSAGIDLPSALDTVPAAPPNDDPDILCGIRALDDLRALPTLDAAAALLQARPWRSAQSAEEMAALPPGALLASVYDPGDSAEGENGRAHRAALAQTVLDTLPDENFLYVESGGTKDAGGCTTPRHLRHFPIRATTTGTGAPDPTESAVLRTLAAEAIPSHIERSALPDDTKRRFRARALRLAADPTEAAPDPSAIAGEVDALLDAFVAAPKSAATLGALRAWMIEKASAPTPPPPAPEPLDGRGGAYEERIEAVRDACNAPSALAPTVSIEPLRTWDDRVLVRRCEDDEPPTYWSIRYHIDHDEAILGAQTMVDAQDPAVRASALAAGPYILDALAVARQTLRFAERTRDLAERRRAEERYFSPRALEVVTDVGTSIDRARATMKAVEEDQRAHAVTEAKAAALRSHAHQQARLRLLALSTP